MKANTVYQLFVLDWNDFRRNPVLWFMVIMPVILSYFIVRVMVNDTVGPAAAVPMWLLFAQSMIGIMTLVLNFVDEKEKKTLEALIVTPASYHSVVLSKMAFVLVLVLVGQFLVLLINGGLVGNVPVLLVLMVLGGILFVMIGLLIGLFSETERNGSAAASALMVLLFLSGVVYETLGPLKVVLRFLPGVLSINTFRDAMLNQPLNSMDVVALVVWVVVLLLVAEWKIRVELNK